jgi:hypothetical protein
LAGNRSQRNNGGSSFREAEAIDVRSQPAWRTLVLCTGLLVGSSWAHHDARCHAQPATAARADLAAALTAEGVEVVTGVRTPLPASVVRLESGDDEHSLHELAGTAGWDRFVEDAVTAPVTVTIEPVTEGDSRLGHRVRMAFVLHVPLEKLQGDEAVKRALGADEGSKGATVKPLTTAELTAAGIEPDGSGREQFIAVEIPLLNRITVRGVVRAEKMESADGTQVAWEFDPRFETVPQWRATWTKIEENELGERVEGQPQPYSGCGGIVTVKKIRAGAEADASLLVVESRMVIREPEAWFQGSNLLRSKIPLTTQEGVRNLRRKLAAAR